METTCPNTCEAEEVKHSLLMLITTLVLLENLSLLHSDACDGHHRSLVAVASYLAIQIFQDMGD